METIFKISSEQDCYGEGCWDGQACAEAIREHLAAYVYDKGLTLAVTFEIVQDTLGFNSESIGDEDLIEELDFQVEQNWPAWHLASGCCVLVTAAPPETTQRNEPSIAAAPVGNRTSWNEMRAS